MTSADPLASQDRPNTARIDSAQRRFYLIGGGIASLATAAFLCRDADVPGVNITIIEALDTLGGSLDADGSAQRGYIMRGGRMFESRYVCTYDLFSSIPTLDGNKTVTREIFDWNETLQTASKSRFVRDGHRVDAPGFALTRSHVLGLAQLALETEHQLGRSRIADHFDAEFFRSNFWLMWCTTFAFQPWHSAVEFKRYLLRFAHMVPGFNQLRGIMRTTYNQYDSMVRPLQKWLSERGVQFEINTRVIDLTFVDENGLSRAQALQLERDGHAETLMLGKDDCVIVTLGSMTEGTTQGAMDRAAQFNGKPSAGAWNLWETIATGRPEFGNPHAFAGHVEQSRWLSFTTTLYSAEFFRAVRDFTGNVPGEGGLMTFVQSSWLISIVLPHQPHFIGQPDDVNVFWGYGLSIDEPGDFIKKPMHACTGREIMTELLGHLGMPIAARSILKDAICIPCLMPYITSQFMPREKGDRPEVVPEGTANLAFVGQFCELPDDVVFTVEYSIRSAQTAVYTLLGLPLEPPSVYKGQYNPRVLYQALHTL